MSYAFGRKAGGLPIGPDRETRLHVVRSFQRTCQYPGEEEPVTPELDRRLEAEAGVRNVGGEVGVDLGGEADRSGAGIQDPVPTLPIELEKTIVLSKKPRREKLPGRMHFLSSNDSVAQAFEVVCATDGEDVRQGDRIARRIDRARIGQLAIRKAPDVQGSDEEGPLGEIEALERLTFQADVVEGAEVEAVGQRPGEPEPSRPELAHRGEDGWEVGAGVADDPLGAGIAGSAELRADPDEGVGPVPGQQHGLLVGV